MVTALPLPDRGLDYGDGLFETMPIIDGNIPWLSYHLERLHQGLQQLEFHSEAHSPVRDYIGTALDDCPVTGVMRLTLTRGTGMRGYAPPEPAWPTCIVQTSCADSAGQPALAPANVGLCSVTLAKQPLLAGIKHLNRLEQVLAARERQQKGLDEMLMTDTSGSAISVISGNIFLVKDNQLLTPTLADCGILGTRRRLVLDELAPALGLDCLQVTITAAEVASADEAFYCNSLRGYQPIGRYGDRRWRRYPTIERLQALYRERLLTCAA
ncbi:aminodeoxychorismate lyase apoprotein [Chromatocurvus halotolerans]|uniref:Aminodeoxychorismate lyase n=1 Tax=Chromatocurvus halotolerans TaxID=1132028 RepID=A0A4R2KJY8_9GAMM|nr:aminodeoxychorismate lyase apoprotein [Chromatocurvus halotolerans]